MKRPANLTKTPPRTDHATKLRGLRRLLMPLLSGSRAQRKAKVNALLRSGYAALADSVGDAIKRDIERSRETVPSRTARAAGTRGSASPFADDIKVISAWMRTHPIRYAHLIEQAEAEFIKTSGITLPDRQ